MSNNKAYKILTCKCGNIESDLIIITHDKLYNILFKNRKKIGIKAKWITPLTFFITILMMLITADNNYKPFLSLSGNTWSVIFKLGAIASFIWVIIMIVKAFVYFKDSTIDSLIDKIKGDKKTKCFYDECPLHDGKRTINAEVLDDIRKGKASPEEDRNKSSINSLLLEKINYLETTKCIYIDDCPLYAKKPPKKGKVIDFLNKVKASMKHRKNPGINLGG
jgi:hypothetical protein